MADATAEAEWDEDQDEWLWRYAAKRGVAYCAQKMGRTCGSVHMRLLTIIAKRCEAAEDIKGVEAIIRESSTHTRIPLKQIDAYLERGGASPTACPATAGLSKSQVEALALVQSGANVFLTGPAGTGKSTVLRAITQWAADNEIEYGVTAMTGCAALLLGGRTLHSFLGIGLARESAKELAWITGIRFKARIGVLNKLQLLIIDEISMCSAELFSKVSEYLGIIRRCRDAPFGGLQVLVVGDYAQLPPINASYAFASAAWEKLAPVMVNMTHNFRQADDAIFQDLLGRARFGLVTEDDIRLLAACSETTFENGIVPTKLYALNRDVDRINKVEMEALCQPQVSYRARCKKKLQKAVGTLGIPEEVTLCLGAQVMITANVDQDRGLVNGTRGVIIGLQLSSVVICVNSGDVVVLGYHESTIGDTASEQELVQYMPLKLAWAISHHKSQGATLDAVELDLGRSIFENGQAYTALSRARNLASIRVVNIDRASFKTDPEVKKFYGV